MVLVDMGVGMQKWDYGYNLMIVVTGAGAGKQES